MIVTKSDFINKYSIANENPFFRTNSDPFIDYEEKYLRLLLGNYAYNEFKNNLTAQKWTDILIDFDFTSNNELFFYRGIKKMLIALCYYHLNLELLNLPSSSGYIKPNLENAENNSDFKSANHLVNAFNDGMSIYRGLYWYFQNNNIEFIKTADSITDNLDGTYTIAISDTSNLLDYSTIMLDGKLYVVSDLDDNTSFKIQEITGKTFSLNFTHKKYNEIKSAYLMNKTFIEY